MKVCKKCGAIQDNDHTVCIDCEEILGSPLSKEEEEKVNKEVAQKIEDLYNKTDYFYVSKLSNIIAALLAIGAFVLILLLIVFKSEFMQEYVMFIISICMLLVAVDVKFPRLSWELSKLKFAFTIANTDDMVPSDYIMAVRKLLSYIMLVVGYILIIYTVIKLILN